MKLALPIVVLTFLTAFYFYPSMPDNMASHWGMNGNVNGYAPKAQLMFLMPVLSLVIYGLLLIMPMIDPLGKNISKFRNYYENFMIMIVAFLLYVFTLTIAWNSGYVFNFSVAMIPAFSVFLFYVGVVMEHAKRNWSIGIRTPWTMSDDRVWTKTHEVGGKVIRASAVITLLGIFAGNLAIYFVIVPILVTVMALFVYSFFIFRKYHK
ncbi:MAG: SdpI family protein [Candidatus Aenigmatarchaeota archaeon]